MNTIKSPNKAINKPITGIATASTTVNIAIKININSINNIIFYTSFIKKFLVSIRGLVYVAKKKGKALFLPIL